MSSYENDYDDQGQVAVAMSALVRGGKVGASGKVASRIAHIVKNALGENYPELLRDNPIGVALEPFIVCNLVYFVAQHFGAVVPKSEVVAEVAEMGMEYSGVKAVEALTGLFSPMFGEISDLVSEIEAGDDNESNKKLSPKKASSEKKA